MFIIEHVRRLIYNECLESFLFLVGVEGSHSGLVRSPAKRFPWVTGDEGSNPSPSAIKSSEYWVVSSERHCSTSVLNTHTHTHTRYQ